jgi:hypothetical protein
MRHARTDFCASLFRFQGAAARTLRYPTVAAGGESELTPIPYCGSLVPGSRTTEVVTSRPPSGPKEWGASVSIHRAKPFERHPWAD